MKSAKVATRLASVAVRLRYVAVLAVGCTLAASAPSCSHGEWRKRFPAPYNTAASEERARIWQRSDELFRDRSDWLNEPSVPEEQRVYPKAIRLPRPGLPTALAGEKGKVTVGYIIEKDGGVRDVRVLFSTNPHLSDVCTSAVREWRFTPGTAAGKPSLWMYEYSCKF